MILNKLLGCNELLAILVIIFLNSCSSKQNSDTYLDSAAVIEKGIDYVFKETSFAPEFYNSPIQIIKSSNVPANLNFVLHGKYCEFTDEKSREAYTGDFLHPIPYVSISKIRKDKNNVIELDLKFPSIGTTFHLKIKEKQGNSLSITDMSDSQEKK